MSASKFPNTPEGIRAELKHLKEKIRRNEAAFRITKKSIPELKKALNGNLDEEALTIIRTIQLSKDPSHVSWLENQPETTELEKKLFEKIRSSDPLLERDKERILKAVCDFDRDFLKSLIAAMDLCETGGGMSGIKNPNVFAVTICYRLFESVENIQPTNRQLLEQLKELYPFTRLMDARTLSFICKSQGLTLARAKPGRPRKMRK